MRVNDTAFIMLVFVSYGCSPYSIPAYQPTYEKTCHDVGHSDDMRMTGIGIMGGIQQDSLDIFLATQRYTYSDLGREFVDTYVSRGGKKIVCKYRPDRYKTLLEEPMKCKVHEEAISQQKITSILETLKTYAFIDWPMHQIPEVQFNPGTRLSIGYQVAKGDPFVVKEAVDTCISKQMRTITSMINSY